jgi:hypothetical protein
MALRHADDPVFEAAWDAYRATRDHVRKEIGQGWQAFFTDVHQSALASAVLVLRKHESVSALRDSLPGGDFTEHREYEVVGGWGVDGAEDAEDARRQVRRALAQYPQCGARAQWRIVRTWDDDAQYYGPWQALEDEEPAR